jgi:3-hydroxyanthranilate 3,4-dioxygenase
MTTTTSVLPPINLQQWVEDNRHLMKPPVGNKFLYQSDDFFVMVIVGPNARNDFHVTKSPEYFYQVKGDVVVRIRENDEIRDVPIREGETFFIPPNVPHSPQRGPDTIGVVVERTRPAGETEHIVFYCEECGALVHDVEFDCADIVEHFRDKMEEFWASDDLRTCQCGKMVEKPGPRA